MREADVLLSARRVDQLSQGGAHARRLGIVSYHRVAQSHHAVAELNCVGLYGVGNVGVLERLDGRVVIVGIVLQSDVAACRDD